MICLRLPVSPHRFSATTPLAGLPARPRCLPPSLGSLRLHSMCCSHRFRSGGGVFRAHQCAPAASRAMRTAVDVWARGRAARARPSGAGVIGGEDGGGRACANFGQLFQQVTAVCMHAALGHGVTVSVCMAIHVGGGATARCRSTITGPTNRCPGTPSLALLSPSRSPVCMAVHAFCPGSRAAPRPLVCAIRAC